MDPLQVDLPALRLLAQRWRDWSVHLDDQPPPPVSTSSSAACAAVAVVHDELRTVGAALAGRMRETAALVEDAARRMLSGETDRAAAFAEATTGA